jgi:hypothetical protein
VSQVILLFANLSCKKTLGFKIENVCDEVIPRVGNTEPSSIALMNWLKNRKTLDEKMHIKISMMPKCFSFSFKRVHGVGNFFFVESAYTNFIANKPSLRALN